MLAYFLQGIVLGVPTAAQPGPFQAFLLHQSISYGWNKTLPAAIAPLLSDGPIILLTFLVLKSLPGNFLVYIRLAGALFLTYLAIGILVSCLKNQDQKDDRSRNNEGGLARAILVNIFGPGPWIFWSTIGSPILVEAFRVSWWQSASFLLGFYLAMVSVFLILILLFSLLGKASARIISVISLISGLILLIYAFVLLRSILISPD